MLVRTPRRQGQPPAMEMAYVPAPVGGLNSVSPGAEMGPQDAIILWNLIAAEYGLRSRLGSREWCTGLTGAADNQVRSVLSFTGSAANGSDNKIFVTTSTGIWDVTSSGGVISGAWASTTAYAVGTFVSASSTVYVCKTAGTSGSAGLPSVWAPTTAYALNARVINNSNVYICTTGGTSAGAGGPSGTGTGITDGTVVWNYQSASTDVTDGTVVWNHKPNNVAPTQALAFASSAGDAGYGVAHVMVTSAGHFLLYCDEVNGYHVYSQTSGTWAAIAMGGGGTQVSGVDPTTFVFVTVFKNRVWFCKRDSASAWYLAADAVYGAAAEFPMGRKLVAGGGIRGLWSWTYDGGAGLDDSLVAVSDGGDLLVWQLEDPAGATVTPLLRGVWSLGGAPPAGRRIATARGGDLLILSRLGALPLSKLVLGASAEEKGIYTTAKIANLFNALMLSKAGLKTWSVHTHPEENAVIITVPGVSNAAETEQLAMSLTNRSWTRFRDLPMFSAGAHEGKLYFGSADGVVYINDGYVDGVTLADSNAYTSIQYLVITAFRNLGNARQKRLELIRPTVLAETATPTYEVHARYRFDQTEPATVAEGVSAQGSWDVGAWDSAVWGGEYTPSQAVRGAAGMGVDVAVAMRGTATARTILVGFDVGFTQGGYL